VGHRNDCLMVRIAVLEELTSCEKAVRESGGLAAPPGAYVPQCDDDGQYKPLQFHASTGHSWCVTTDGTEIPGTRTPPGKPPANCQPFTDGTKLQTTCTQCCIQ